MSTLPVARPHVKPASGRRVEIRNGGTRVVVDLDLGAEIRWLGSAESNLLASYDWPDPPARGDGAAGEWLRRYRGGWQTLFPNIGPDSSWLGDPLGYHGAWSRTRVAVLAHDHDRIAVSAAVPHGLRLTRELRVTPSGSVEIEQTIANPRSVRLPYLAGEHPAFDLPPGTLLELPPGPVRVAPKSPEFGDLVAGSAGTWPFAPGAMGAVDLSSVPRGPVERTCYLPERRAGRLAVRFPGAQDRVTGFRIEWDVSELPHVCLWQQIGGRGEPYCGRTRITALELLSAWPADGLTAALARGAGSWLEPGEARTTALAVCLLAEHSREGDR